MDPLQNNISIRRAIAEDAEAITRLMVDGQKEIYKGKIPEEVIEAGFDNALVNRVRIIGLDDEGFYGNYVAVNQEGKIVGFASLGDCRNYAAIPYDFTFAHNYVHKDYRRVGIGRALMVERAKELQRIGATNVAVVIEPDNEKSLQMVVSMGAKLTKHSYREEVLDGYEMDFVMLAWEDFPLKFNSPMTLGIEKKINPPHPA